MTPRSPRDPDALLRRAGVRGNPDRDQHFLVDDRVLDRLPGYLPVEPAGAHLLEVGAGTGALTDRLLRAVGPDGHVTAVERDPALAAFLREEFADELADGRTGKSDRSGAGRLTVVEGDATEIAFPEVDASVSNLPYGASSEILFRLLPLGVPLVLMLQREFAERMAAEPGSDDYGRLSVTAGHYAATEVVEPVPPEAFAPPPAVDSAVVRVVPREPDYDAPEGLFGRFVTACFTQRRKTMRNAVRNTAHISGLGDPDAVVDAAGEELMGRRAGTVTPAEFARLARLAAEVGEPA